MMIIQYENSADYAARDHEHYTVEVRPCKQIDYNVYLWHIVIAISNDRAERKLLQSARLSIYV